MRVSIYNIFYILNIDTIMRKASFFYDLIDKISNSCNVGETLICKLVYLFNVFGEHGRYIGNINHLW